KSSSSIRSDCASIPTLGSRSVGLFSIIITSKSASGLREQDANARQSNVAASGRRRLRGITGKKPSPALLDARHQWRTEYLTASGATFDTQAQQMPLLPWLRPECRSRRWWLL